MVIMSSENNNNNIKNKNCPSSSSSSSPPSPSPPSSMKKKVNGNDHQQQQQQQKQKLQGTNEINVVASEKSSTSTTTTTSSSTNSLTIMKKKEAAAAAPVVAMSSSSSSSSLANKVNRFNRMNNHHKKKNDQQQQLQQQQEEELKYSKIIIEEKKSSSNNTSSNSNSLMIMKKMKSEEVVNVATPSPSSPPPDVIVAVSSSSAEVHNHIINNNKVNDHQNQNQKKKKKNDDNDNGTGSSNISRTLNNGKNNNRSQQQKKNVVNVVQHQQQQQQHLQQEEIEEEHEEEHEGLNDVQLENDDEEEDNNSMNDPDDTYIKLFDIEGQQQPKQQDNNNFNNSNSSLLDNSLSSFGSLDTIDSHNTSSSLSSLRHRGGQHRRHHSSSSPTTKKTSSPMRPTTPKPTRLQRMKINKKKEQQQQKMKKMKMMTMMNKKKKKIMDFSSLLFKSLNKKLYIFHFLVFVLILDYTMLNWSSTLMNTNMNNFLFYDNLIGPTTIITTNTNTSSTVVQKSSSSSSQTTTTTTTTTTGPVVLMGILCHQLKDPKTYRTNFRKSIQNFRKEQQQQKENINNNKKVICSLGTYLEGKNDVVHRGGEVCDFVYTFVVFKEGGNATIVSEERISTKDGKLIMDTSNNNKNKNKNTAPPAALGPNNDNHNDDDIVILNSPNKYIKTSNKYITAYQRWLNYVGSSNIMIDYVAKMEPQDHDHGDDNNNDYVAEEEQEKQQQDYRTWLAIVRSNFPKHLKIHNNTVNYVAKMESQEQEPQQQQPTTIVSNTTTATRHHHLFNFHEYFDFANEYLPPGPNNNHRIFAGVFTSYDWCKWPAHITKIPPGRERPRPSPDRSSINFYSHKEFYILSKDLLDDVNNETKRVVELSEFWKHRRLPIKNNPCEPLIDNYELSTLAFQTVEPDPINVIAISEQHKFWNSNNNNNKRINNANNATTTNNDNDNDNDNTALQVVHKSKSSSTSTRGGGQQQQQQQQHHVAGLSLSSQSSTPTPPKKKKSATVLMGIFCRFQDKKFREKFRIIFDMHPKVCSLGTYKRKMTMIMNNDTEVDNNNNMNPSSFSSPCELVYAFVIGGNTTNLNTTPREIVTGDLDQLVIPNAEVVDTTTALKNTNIKHFTLDEEEVRDHNDDFIFLNILENMNEGKSTTWFYAASQLASMYDNDIDYIGKMDTDTLIRLDQYFDFANDYLLPSPYNKRRFASLFADKNWWEDVGIFVHAGKERFIDAQKELYYKEHFPGSHPTKTGVHVYAQGQMYIMSTDLARGVADIAHRSSLNDDNYYRNHLEGIEDMDVSTMAYLSSDGMPLNIIAIKDSKGKSKSKKFYSHGGRLKGNKPKPFEWLWKTEIDRMKNITEMLY